MVHIKLDMNIMAISEHENVAVLELIMQHIGLLTYTKKLCSSSAKTNNSIHL